MPKTKPEPKLAAALIEAPKDGNHSEPELSAWALVELFGHARIVGYLSQQNFQGGVLFRVDVPDLMRDGKLVRKGFTRYFGLGAVYSITPVDEATVKRMLPSIDGTPGEARPLTLESFRRYGEEENYG